MTKKKSPPTLDPTQALEALYAADPEKGKAMFTEYLKKQPREKLIEIAKIGKSKRVAMEFSEQSFADFFFVMTGFELAPYARDVWTPAVFEAYRNHSGVMLEGFRGATKSSFLFWWILYVTGHNPVGSSVLARISDGAAAETGKAMAAIIEISPAWKMCFPHVIPVTAMWSTDGYYVRDTRVDEGEWRQRCIADHLGEPTILCAGIASGIHIGKHPTNGFYFDDFHNESNSSSVREMQRIVNTLESDIIPTWNRPLAGHPTLVGACTLWNEKDGYHALLRTGLFKHVKTPIFTRDETSTVIYKGLSHYGEPIKLAWAKGYPLKKVMELERRDPVHFPRNYLCDLTAEKGAILKRDWLGEFPAEKIQADYPAFFGVDFASANDSDTAKDRDFFSLAIGRETPDNSLVIQGGRRGKFSTAYSLDLLKELASNFSNFKYVGIEKYGKGEEFFNQVRSYTTLPVLALPAKGTLPKSKGARYANELAPDFVSKRIMLSDVSDEYLTAFRSEWVGWQGDEKHTGVDDDLDACYYAWLTWKTMGRRSGFANLAKEANSKAVEEGTDVDEFAGMELISLNGR